jgi:hypothetical protein
MRGLFGALCALGTITVVVIVLVSAGPGARAARADTSTTPPCDPGTDVTIDSGPICGLSATGVSGWLGIPLSSPPSRWGQRKSSFSPVRSPTRRLAALAASAAAGAVDGDPAGHRIR